MNSGSKSQNALSDRYSRQVLFDGIGGEGQDSLLRSRVAIIGCGALGSAQAESLARAGVGSLTLVDRDFVEFSNLQRQTMFTERDATERLPKVIAGAKHLHQINSDVQVKAEIADVTRTNIERLIDGCDLVMDGTDNFATRYLINDACVKHDIDWIYGAAVGSLGVTMTIRPHATPCLSCVFPEAPTAGSAPTCDTAGVIMPIISVVAALQVSEALKLLTGQTERLHGSLMQFDLWRNEWRQISLKERAPDCSACVMRRFGSLDNDGQEFAAILCGRHAVQISPAQPVQLDLGALGRKLAAAGNVNSNEYLLRFRTGEYELTVFQDARSIIRGTNDIATARSLYAKYIGN